MDDVTLNVGNICGILLQSVTISSVGLLNCTAAQTLCVNGCCVLAVAVMLPHHSCHAEAVSVGKKDCLAHDMRGTGVISDFLKSRSVLQAKSSRSAPFS